VHPKKTTENNEKRMHYTRKITIVVKPEIVNTRWKEYMEHLLIMENVWDRMVEDGIVGCTRESIAEMERATEQMKSGWIRERYRGTGS